MKSQQKNVAQEAKTQGFLQALSTSQKKTAAALFFLIICFVIFYAQLLSGSRFLWEDYMEQAYPNVRFAADCLRHGQLPLWTPYIFGGMPYASDPQSTLFYPPYWIYLIVSLFTEPGGLAFTWYILLHVLLLGTGTFFLMRGMRLGRGASLVSAVTFMFAGFVSLHIFHTFIYVAAWFPLAFHFLRTSLEKRSVRDGVIGGIFLGISTLGGYPQYSMHFIYFCAAWTAFSWLRTGKPTLPRTTGHAISFGLFVAIGLALASVQYLPSFENMAESVRETMTFDESVKGAMSIPRLATLFSPTFFGRVAPSQPDAVPFWGVPSSSWCFWETCIFVGILPLFLALRAIMEGKKSPQSMFLAAIAGVSVLLALGAATPLYSLVFHLAPGFKNFRIPGRFAFLFTFCIALLAGKGMEQLLADTVKERLRYFKASAVFAGLILAVCLLYLAGAFSAGSPYLTMEKVKAGADRAVAGTIVTTLAVIAAIAWVTFKQVTVRSWMAAAAAGFVFVELFAFGHSFAVANVNPKAYYGRFDLSPLKRELAAGSFRVQGRIYRGEGAGEMLFPRNLGNVVGIPFVDGYNQLRLSRWNDLMWNVDVEKGRKLFNIRYHKVPGQYQLMPVEAVPRFYLSTTATVAGSREAVIAAMNGDSFLPGRDVVLEKELGITLAGKGTVTGKVTVDRENVNRLELTVTAPENALLSISELYYPAWRAKIDGKKTGVFAANCAFRALPVTAGTHRVVMYYQSDAMRKGAMVSLAALVAVLIYLFVVPVIVRGKKDKNG